MLFDSVLCVCTGNICRSPLAAAYLRRALPSLSIASAGVAALVGNGADGQAKKIAAREGLDISGHVARQVSASLVAEHDLILVMEDQQRQWVRAHFPEFSGRVFLVSRWQDSKDVADPFHASEAYYDAVYRRLCGCLDDWIDKIKPAPGVTI